MFIAVLRIRIRWIRKILASWIRIWTQREIYQQKTEEKNLLSNPNHIEKIEIIKIS